MLNPGAIAEELEAAAELEVEAVGAAVVVDIGSSLNTRVLSRSSSFAARSILRTSCLDPRNRLEYMLVPLARACDFAATSCSYASLRSLKRSLAASWYPR